MWLKIHREGDDDRIRLSASAASTENRRVDCHPVQECRDGQDEQASHLGDSKQQDKAILAMRPAPNKPSDDFARVAVREGRERFVRQGLIPIDH